MAEKGKLGLPQTLILPDTTQPAIALIPSTHCGPAHLGGLDSSPYVWLVENQCVRHYCDMVALKCFDDEPANQEAFHHQLLEYAEGEYVCCLAVSSNLNFKRI